MTVTPRTPHGDRHVHPVPENDRVVRHLVGCGSLTTLSRQDVLGVEGVVVALLDVGGGGGEFAREDIGHRT